jgi:hypothetical protein
MAGARQPMRDLSPTTSSEYMACPKVRRVVLSRVGGSTTSPPRRIESAHCTGVAKYSRYVKYRWLGRLLTNVQKKMEVKAILECGGESDREGVRQCYICLTLKLHLWHISTGNIDPISERSPSPRPFDRFQLIELSLLFGRLPTA